ncbi:MAG: hypothetical protein DWI02_07385 [Planctomycetota bacterium]|jgi:hypothetical protein|nr:MAG: hypothetical protein DWI02_07385 [Planctomycetota bacterium]
MGCFGNLTQGRKVAGTQRKIEPTVDFKFANANPFFVFFAPLRLGALALNPRSRISVGKNRAGYRLMGTVPERTHLSV